MPFMGLSMHKIFIYRLSSFVRASVWQRKRESLPLLWENKLPQLCQELTTLEEGEFPVTFICLVRGTTIMKVTLFFAD